MPKPVDVSTPSDREIRVARVFDAPAKLVWDCHTKPELIRRGRDAQRRPCRIEAKPLEEANMWIERYRELWEAAYQRLDGLLEEMKTQKKD